LSAAISSLDHVVVLAADHDAAIASYAALLGAEPVSSEVEEGVATTVFATANIAVELMSPLGAGARADRVRAALADGEGIKSLVFGTHDVAAMHRRASRVGLEPGEIVEGRGQKNFRLADAKLGGVRLFVLQRELGLRAPPEAGVLGLDHIVVRTGDAERAAANYGARLGLDMRLDREVRGRRLMFFRCGDSIVEIAHEPGLERDALWGLSWRVRNADAARARLSAAGFDVSEVRVGAKPGTRVFTVRNRACGVPTLMLELSPAGD